MAGGDPGHSFLRLEGQGAGLALAPFLFRRDLDGKLVDHPAIEAVGEGVKAEPRGKRAGRM